MKKAAALLIALSLVSLPARADSHQDLNKVLDEVIHAAGQVEADAKHISTNLKSKQPDTQFVRDKIQALSGDLTSLDTAMSHLEQKSTLMSDWQKKDHETLKMKVQLVKNFYDAKKELALAEDVAKNRSMLRAHADGLAQRAALVSSTASKMQK
jgi:hypothetical protein